MHKGNLFVISAPSGAGKTTVLQQVLELPAIGFSVSHTTRAPRPGETDGKDYFFVSQQEFTKLREQDAFLEWAEVHGNYYGTSRQAVVEMLEQGKDVVLDIDVQGAAQIRIRADIHATFIFIAPPSLTELKRRLTGRGTEDNETVALRLNNARRELAAMDGYDYIVVNDDLSEAVDTVRAIVIEHRARSGRTATGVAIDLERLRA